MATEGYKSKQYNQPTKRFVQTMKLKDDSELIKNYMEARCGDAAIKSRGMDFEGLKDLYLDEKNVSNNHVGCCTNVCTSFS